MPLFLFGQVGGGQPPSFPMFRDPKEQNAATKATITFVLNELLNKGIEEILAGSGLSPFAATEIGSELIAPTPLGQGEEAAIAQQQERERSTRAAMEVMDRPKPIHVEQTDP